MCCLILANSFIFIVLKEMAKLMKVYAKNA